MQRVGQTLGKEGGETERGEQSEREGIIEGVKDKEETGEGRTFMLPW